MITGSKTPVTIKIIGNLEIILSVIIIFIIYLSYLTFKLTCRYGAPAEQWSGGRLVRA